MSQEFIDAHHHLWKYSKEQYPWMLAGMESIRRDFLIPELQEVTREAAVTGTVAVQARQMLEESRWLLGLAAQTDLIRGVVGWVPLVESGVAAHLEMLSADSKFKGVRHVLHDEVDDFYMLRDDFNRGIALLKNFNLRYDILIFERHLPQTIQFVDRHPNQIFIVDHIAKPKIKDRILSPWDRNIAELAKRENVYCKISGMVTEANWKNWGEEDLSPYFDKVLTAFGPQRLMIGSDWPVILVASEYSHWISILRRWIDSLSSAEELYISSKTAVTAYRL
ncbi:MAG TPA: amidohydrolase family protein [Terriglobales bacterium]|nr:amidohydrolase family protein [Terriglobales bacterium]